jgi:hypothetical protein
MNKIILRMDRFDPYNFGITRDLEPEDSTSEFSGTLYFSANSATYFIVNASNYTIESYQDAAKRSYEINISYPKSRLNLFGAKNVFGNGWIVVFANEDVPCRWCTGAKLQEIDVFSREREHKTLRPTHGRQFSLKVT